MIRKTVYLFFAVVMILFVNHGCIKKIGKLPVAAPAPPVNICDSATYALKIKNILDNKCGTAGCHSGPLPQSGYDFTNYSIAVAHVDRIKARAIDANPSIMPPAGNPQLTPDEKSILQCWINNPAHP